MALHLPFSENFKKLQKTAKSCKNSFSKKIKFFLFKKLAFSKNTAILNIVVNKDYIKILTAENGRKRSVTMGNKKNTTATAKTANTENKEKTLAEQITEFNTAMLPADIVFNSAEFESLVKVTKNGERQNTGKLTTAFLLANTPDVLSNYTLQDLILYYAVAYKITITGDSKGNSISQKLRDQAAAMKVSFKNSHAGTGKAARVEMEHKAELSAMATAHTAEIAEIAAQSNEEKITLCIDDLQYGMPVERCKTRYTADVFAEALRRFTAQRNTELLQILNENNITTPEKLRELIAKAK